jgi:hypothetical protein
MASIGVASDLTTTPRFGARAEPRRGSNMSDADDAGLKAALAKEEDARSEEDWALLAKALETEHDHLAEVAHETGHDLDE